jgi:hypothetical protein
MGNSDVISVDVDSSTAAPLSAEHFASQVYRNPAFDQQQIIEAARR